MDEYGEPSSTIGPSNDLSGEEGLVEVMCAHIVFWSLDGLELLESRSDSY